MPITAPQGPCPTCCRFLQGLRGPASALGRDGGALLGHLAQVWGSSGMRERCHLVSQGGVTWEKTERDLLYFLNKRGLFFFWRETSCCHLSPRACLRPRLQETSEDTAVPALGWWVHRGPLKGLRGRRGPGLKPGPQGQRPDRCRLGAAAVEEGETRTPPQSKAGADAVGGARWAWAGPAGFPRVLSVILEALIRLTRSTETVANGV